MDMEARFREMAQEEIKVELAALRGKNAELSAALEPFVEWLNHLEAIGSRRLENDEAADIFGGPRMGVLRRARALLIRPTRRFRMTTASIEQDAKRYRWLRSNASLFQCITMCEGVELAMNGEELDAAIDSIIEKDST